MDRWMNRARAYTHAHTGQTVTHCLVDERRDGRYCWTIGGLSKETHPRIQSSADNAGSFRYGMYVCGGGAFVSANVNG